MQSRRQNPNTFGWLLGIMIGCAVISGISGFSLLDPLYAGVLPKDGDSQYELTFWESIKDSDQPEDYEAYLEAYPGGRFAPLAKARAAYLRIKSGSAPAPSAPQIDEMAALYEVVRSANLRVGPSTTSPIVGALGKGTKVRVTGRVAGKNWFRINTKTGLSGFIYGGLIEKHTTPSTATSPDSVPSEPRTPEPRESVAKEKQSALPKAPRPNIEARQFPPFKDCPECPEMVMLPAGRFIMGDAGDATEKPAHTVTIGKPFAIGKHEVTVAEWNACVLDGGCSYSPEIAGTDPAAPVRDISWTDTGKYVSWLNAKTGKSYRLPTEAEWEYAARGGTKTRFWWGDRLAKGQANCTDCGGEYDRKSPATIRSFDPNPFGLHEMTGGVWEWVLDCWHNNYNGAPKDGSAWDEDLCRVRVLRGGSWRNDSSYIHSASRFKYDADVRYLTNGFRVARSQ